MKYLKSTMVCVAAVFILYGLAGAKEKKLQKSDLPPAVQTTADQQSVGATVKGYASEVEHGNLQYEVELIVSGHSKDITIAPDGKLIEVEEEVALDSLPAPVRDALRKKAGAGRITKVESLTKHGSLVAYEAQVVSGKKHAEVQVDPAGKDLAHEE
jgi:uncharacterized membrane protein YkoI